MNNMVIGTLLFSLKNTDSGSISSQLVDKFSRILCTDSLHDIEIISENETEIDYSIDLDNSQMKYIIQHHDQIEKDIMALIDANISILSFQIHCNGKFHSDNKRYFYNLHFDSNEKINCEKLKITSKKIRGHCFYVTMDIFEQYLPSGESSASELELRLRFVNSLGEDENISMTCDISRNSIGDGKRRSRLISMKSYSCINAIRLDVYSWDIHEVEKELKSYLDKRGFELIGIEKVSEEKE
jgi:hypothetical protein